MTQPRTATPLVSVIMIFLDAARFMPEAIASVEAQTHRRWELLLVDDGSTDGSSAIARAAADRRPDAVTYLSHPGRRNRGMSASRNLGLAEAQGSFIAFLDADDVYLPEKLEYQLRILESEPRASFTYGPALHWRSWSDSPPDAGRDHLRGMPRELDRLYEPLELVDLFLARRAATPATCSALIRREAIERVGGFEARFTGMYEDQAFFYKLCAHEPCFAHSRSLERYRRHPDSAVSRAALDGTWAVRGGSQTHAAFMDWLGSYLAASGVLDEERRRLVRRAEWPYRHPQLHRMARTWWKATDRLRHDALSVSRRVRRRR